MGNGYKSLLKATIVMSGAQIIEALMSIVRAKVIALLLGPIGIALNSIFLITLNTLYQVTSVGLPQSAIRDIAQSQNSENSIEQQKIISAFKTLIRLLAVIAFLFCIFAAPVLSNLSFGVANNHTTDFIILSVGACAMLLSYGNTTILQGMQRLNALAQTTIFAAISSVIIAIPLLYFFNHKGVSLAISCGFIITFIINSLYVKRLSIKRIRLSWNEVWTIGSPMIKLGIIIMFSSLLMNLFTYLTNILIRFFGSIEDVGYFQAAYSITMRNFSILAATLIADFYPRLSKALDNKKEFNNIVSEEAELLIILISIVSVILILFTKPILWLLLSAEFYSIELLTQCITFSLLFRIMWATLSYIPLAHGDKKMYLIYDALLGNGGNFIITIAAYYLFGLNGIGFAMIIGNIFVSLLLYFVYKKHYGMDFNNSFWKLQSIYIVLLGLFMSTLFVRDSSLYYVANIILLAIFTFFSYRELNNRIDIKQFIKSKFHK